MNKPDKLSPEEELYCSLFSKHEHPILDGTEVEAWITIADAFDVAKDFVQSQVDILTKERDELIDRNKILNERCNQLLSEIDSLKEQLRDLKNFK